LRCFAVLQILGFFTAKMILNKPLFVLFVRFFRGVFAAFSGSLRPVFSSTKKLHFSLVGVSNAAVITLAGQRDSRLLLQGGVANGIDVVDAHATQLLEALFTVVAAPAASVGVDDEKLQIGLERALLTVEKLHLVHP